MKYKSGKQYHLCLLHFLCPVQFSATWWSATFLPRTLSFSLPQRKIGTSGSWSFLGICLILDASWPPTSKNLKYTPWFQGIIEEYINHIFCQTYQMHFLLPKFTKESLASYTMPFISNRHPHCRREKWWVLHDFSSKDTIFSPCGERSLSPSPHTSSPSGRTGAPAHRPTCFSMCAKVVAPSFPTS